MRYITCVLTVFHLAVCGHPGIAEVLRSEDAVWKAGVASTVITPEEPMWMGGYAARDRPAEGKLQDLWAKALALEDASGKQAVLVTMDLIGIPKNLSERIRDHLETRFGLSRAQVILNSSHTHSGPVLERSVTGFFPYPVDTAELKKIHAYGEQLVEQVTALVGEALRVMKPARLYARNGVTRFQVNRRNNSEATLDQVTELQGPNDFAVPVIKVEDEAGKIMAVAFGYACHPTVLDGYEWSGDYPGFAQQELEAWYPGATALFFQGAGADQNPLPRRSVALAQQYGRTLAAAVARVLDEEMPVLPSRISTAYTEIPLPLSAPPAKEELSRMAEELSGYQKRWARHILRSLEKGEPLRDTYPYPLQAWMLGDQPVLALGGELVVDYAIELKRIFGTELFVMGYSNDVMGYIPSARILREGGYEGAGSQIVYGLPGRWDPLLETLILSEMVKLAEQAGIPKASQPSIKN